MKQTVATSTVFKAILAFTFLFSAFIAVAITYNKAYKLKNETISIFEKYEGISNKSIELVDNYLINSGYNTTGNCRDGEFGVYDLINNKYEKAKNNKKYYYCIDYFCDDTPTRDSVNKICRIPSKSNPVPNNIYYSVKLFFKFNLPFFGDLFTFKVTGDTKAIKLYEEWQKLK